MLRELKFVDGGMGINEGAVGRWLKAEGDRFVQGEVLVELETAKAITEVCAPVTGVLHTILIPQGATVEVNTTLALLSDGGGASGA